MAGTYFQNILIGIHVSKIIFWTKIVFPLANIAYV